MKNIGLLAMTLIFGMFINLNIGYAAPEQQRQDRQRQDRTGQQQQERFQQDRAVQLDQLPQAVQETLRDDYEDWNATEASMTSDPQEEESFYMIKLNDREERESKIVMINTDGDVIEEEEVMMLRERQRDRRRDDDNNGDDDWFSPVSYEQQQRRDERTSRVDSLPRPVESTILNDYNEWSPTEAHLATDPNDQTVYYIIKMHNAGEGETQVVRITSDGEVMDEQTINPLDDIDDLQDDDNDNDNDRRRRRRDNNDNDDDIF